MVDINLLPQELKPNKSVLVIANKFKKISIIFISFFLLIFLVIIGIQYYYTKKIQESNIRQLELEAQIKSMEKTEQQLILVKDRIEKVMLIISQGTTADEVDIIEKVSNLIPGGVLIKNITFDKDLVQITVVAASLEMTSEYINSVTSMTGLKYINLISFDFSPVVGYTVDLSFIPGSTVNSEKVI